VLRPGDVLRRSQLLQPAGLLRRAELLLRSKRLCRAGRLRPGLRQLASEEVFVMTTRHSTAAIWTDLSSDLRRFIFRRVSDDHVADDLLQETFVRIHRNIGTLREADRLAAWVYQIARNVILDHHRKASKAAVALGDFEPAETRDDPPSRCRDGAWLNEMIRSLPDGYHDAVQLSEIEGLTQTDVADRLGLSLSGAKSRIQRGRSLLKDELEKCCRFEFDGRGQMMDCDPNPGNTACGDCGDSIAHHGSA